MFHDPLGKLRYGLQAALSGGGLARTLAGDQAAQISMTPLD